MKVIEKINPKETELNGLNKLNYFSKAFLDSYILRQFSFIILHEQS